MGRAETWAGKVLAVGLSHIWGCQSQGMNLIPLSEAWTQTGQRSKSGKVGTCSPSIPRPRHGERLLQGQGPLQMPRWP